MQSPKGHPFGRIVKAAPYARCRSKTPARVQNEIPGQVQGGNPVWSRMKCLVGGRGKTPLRSR